MRALLFAALAILCSCASPYSESGITGGFDDRQLNADSYIISYFGNSYTTEETVQTYWLHHAATLALDKGYDGFEVTSDTRFSALAPKPDAQIVPVVDSGLTGKPYLVARIRLLHAPIPEVIGRTFDAHALKTFLDPYIQGEHCTGNVCPHVHRYLLPGFAAQQNAPTT